MTDLTNLSDDELLSMTDLTNLSDDELLSMIELESIRKISLPEKERALAWKEFRAELKWRLGYNNELLRALVALRSIADPETDIVHKEEILFWIDDTIEQGTQPPYFTGIDDVNAIVGLLAIYRSRSEEIAKRHGKEVAYGFMLGALQQLMCELFKYSKENQEVPTY